MLFEFLVGQVFPEYRDRSVVSIGSFKAISDASVDLAVATFEQSLVSRLQYSLRGNRQLSCSLR